MESPIHETHSTRPLHRHKNLAHTKRVGASSQTLPHCTIANENPSKKSNKHYRKDSEEERCEQVSFVILYNLAPPSLLDCLAVLTEEPLSSHPVAGRNAQSTFQPSRYLWRNVPELVEHPAHVGLGHPHAMRKHLARHATVSHLGMHSHHWVNGIEWSLARKVHHLLIYLEQVGLCP